MSRMVKENVSGIEPTTLVFLLIAHVSVLLPHLQTLPVWISLMSLACCVWRIQIMRNPWFMPGKFMRIAIVVLGFTAIYFEYHTVIGPMAGVALLILAYSFKLLEARTQRDAYLVIFLAYFVVATAFLFDQAFTKALYLLFSSVLISGALFSINQTDWGFYRSYKKVTQLLLQSLPLMIVLFVFVPRIQPLWSIALDSKQGRMGLSDEMNPGDISKLIGSDELVFRVKFSEAMPPPSLRYWRALVLDSYDGRRWTRHREADDSDSTKNWFESYRSFFAELDQDSAKNNFLARYRYDIVMEASHQKWLFALDWAFPLSEGVTINPDYQLSASRPVDQAFFYSVESVMLKDETIPGDWMQRNMNTALNLRLPEASNPHSSAWAKQLRQQSDSDVAFVQSLLAHFHMQPFFYTLQPPLLGKNAIDDFFFSTRKGFCEHYASAFTFMARSAGIPARVVIGYQGGEPSRFDNYLRIYQFDAHAWSEVWLPPRGWVRIDPTAAVSPSRVEKGIESALEEDSQSSASNAVSWLRYRHMPWTAYIRHGTDYLRVLWIQKVVGYNTTQQSQLFSTWFRSNELRTTMLVLLASVSLSLSGVGLSLFYKRGRKKLKPEHQMYATFCKRLATQGYIKNPGEGENDFAKRVALHRPDLAASVQHITRMYSDLVYSSACNDSRTRTDALAELKTAIKQFPLNRTFSYYLKN